MVCVILQMKQPSLQLGPMTPINETKPLSHKQQEIETAGPSVAKSGPNLAERFLLQGIFWISSFNAITLYSISYPKHYDF